MKQKWSREEWIVVLYHYFRLNPAKMNKAHPDSARVADAVNAIYPDRVDLPPGNWAI